MIFWWTVSCIFIIQLNLVEWTASCSYFNMNFTAFYKSLCLLLWKDVTWNLASSDFRVSPNWLLSFSCSRLCIIAIDIISFYTWEKLNVILCKMFQKAGVDVLVGKMGQMLWSKGKLWTYIGWICWLLGNCAKDWNHRISIFKKIIWKKRLITFFNESSHPLRKTISGWSSIHFLNEKKMLWKQLIHWLEVLQYNINTVYLLTYCPTL